MAAATITLLRDLTRRMAYNQAIQTTPQEATQTIQMSALTILAETITRVSITNSLPAIVVTVATTHSTMNID